MIKAAQQKKEKTMKKIATLTMILGIILLLFGAWLIQDNKGFREAAERRAGCDVVYGLEPVNVREKETCLAEADDIEAAYKDKVYTSVGVGLVVVVTSAFVIVKKRRAKVDN